MWVVPVVGIRINYEEVAMVCLFYWARDGSALAQWQWRQVHFQQQWRSAQRRLCKGRGGEGVVDGLMWMMDGLQGSLGRSRATGSGPDTLRTEDQFNCHPEEGTNQTGWKSARKHTATFHAGIFCVYFSGC